MIELEECKEPFCFILKYYICLKEKKNIILFKKCSVADETIKILLTSLKPSEG